MEESYDINQKWNYKNYLVFEIIKFLLVRRICSNVNKLVICNDNVC